jgi:GNAT superfamily N-acetyltransferase
MGFKGGKHPLGMLATVMDKIELRCAVPGDAGAIRRLTREAYAKWVPLIGREPKPMQADYEAAVLNHRFDLAYVDGVLGALIETADEGDRLLVVNVAVSPDLQGRGLGSKLLAHAEEIARALGRRRIRLYTNRRFAENIRLYQRLGYAIDREEGDRVDMSKTTS